MTKKDDGLLDLLAEFPRWVSALIAGTAYVLLRFILPTTGSDNAPVRT